MDISTVTSSGNMKMRIHDSESIPAICTLWMRGHLFSPFFCIWNLMLVGSVLYFSVTDYNYNRSFCMRIIVAGGGQAGYTAAKKLKLNLPEADILLFDTDTCGLYAKMRLPDYIAGKVAREKLILASPEAMASQGIEVHPGETVEKIDPAAKTLLSSAGKTYAWDKLVLANGADAFVPPVKGIENVEAFTLRTLRDADNLIARSQESKDVIVIGGGLLGLEAAWALRERGLHVTVIEFMNRLLPRQLNETESAVLQEKLSAMGLAFRLGISATELHNGAAAHSVKVTFSDGSALEAGLLLFSAGIRSRIHPAADCGIKINKAIVVDHKFQTSLPDIYAIGDCAEIDGRTWGLWVAAKDQGDALGDILGGKREMFESPVYTPNLKISGFQLKDLCGNISSEAH